MSDRSLQRAVALVVTALLGVIAVGSVMGSRSVADDLRHRAETALTASGLDDVRVDFRGREAHLSGGNDVESRMASSLVAALPGVRSVDRAVDHDAPLHGASRFALDRAGDDVEISGAVPSPDDAADLKIAVASGLATRVVGDVKVDRSVDAAPWVASLPAVLRTVVAVAGLELDIPGDGTLHVGGRVVDASTRSRIVQRLTDQVPGLRLVETLDVAPRAGA
ncbi:hypothetical protein [Aeromicrobium wangtongii]|uniref:hypothetical protein n=1 Tax=Aeromicrobium wangtongii TaxID=2969247 RepID=UPI002016D53A|nr:hypothetical protein [Aeromicrobium wangtongii]MCL3818055.1 hypothetical protein [Aeromicrobium wangtongii]